MLTTKINMKTTKSVTPCFKKLTFPILIFSLVMCNQPFARAGEEVDGAAAIIQNQNKGNGNNAIKGNSNGRTDFFTNQSTVSQEKVSREAFFGGQASPPTEGNPSSRVAPFFPVNPNKTGTNENSKSDTDNQKPTVIPYPDSGVPIPISTRDFYNIKIFPDPGGKTNSQEPNPIEGGDEGKDTGNLSATIDTTKNPSSAIPNTSTPIPPRVINPGKTLSNTPNRSKDKINHQNAARYLRSESENRARSLIQHNSVPPIYGPHTYSDSNNNSSLIPSNLISTVGKLARSGAFSHNPESPAAGTNGERANNNKLCQPCTMHESPNSLMIVKEGQPISYLPKNDQQGGKKAITSDNSRLPKNPGKSTSTAGSSNGKTASTPSKASEIVENETLLPDVIHGPPLCGNDAWWRQKNGYVPRGNIWVRNDIHPGKSTSTAGSSGKAASTPSKASEIVENESLLPDIIHGPPLCGNDAWWRQKNGYVPRGNIWVRDGIHPGKSTSTAGSSSGKTASTPSKASEIVENETKPNIDYSKNYTYWNETPLPDVIHGPPLCGNNAWWRQKNGYVPRGNIWVRKNIHSQTEPGVTNYSGKGLINRNPKREFVDSIPKKPKGQSGGSKPGVANSNPKSFGTSDAIPIDISGPPNSGNEAWWRLKKIQSNREALFKEKWEEVKPKTATEVRQFQIDIIREEIEKLRKLYGKAITYGTVEIPNGKGGSTKIKLSKAQREDAHKRLHLIVNLNRILDVEGGNQIAKLKFAEKYARLILQPDISSADPRDVRFHGRDGNRYFDVRDFANARMPGGDELIRAYENRILKDVAIETREAVMEGFTQGSVNVAKGLNSLFAYVNPMDPVIQAATGIKTSGSDVGRKLSLGERGYAVGEGVVGIVIGKYISKKLKDATDPEVKIPKDRQNSSIKSSPSSIKNNSTVHFSSSKKINSVSPKQLPKIQKKTTLDAITIKKPLSKTKTNNTSVRKTSEENISNLQIGEKADRLPELKAAIKKDSLAVSLEIKSTKYGGRSRQHQRIQLVACNQKG